jgi:uncharacterized membrane protein
MSDIARSIAAIGLAFALGAAVPAGFMRMLAPSFEREGRVTNYRGREVFPGLGVVWLVWAGCAIVCGVVASGWLGGHSLLPVLTLLGPLALVAFALGVVDDAFGNRDDRGFRGHLRALAHGRMTTGMLKLIGIGAASFVVALILGQVAPWGGGLAPIWRRIVGAALATASIALTANLVNLTDLRPGRALKVYSLLVIGGIAVTPGAMAASGVFGDMGISRIAAESLALLLAFLGPVFAVWHYDLGERGMLGDAGANAMGAVVGALIVLGLPFWGLIGYTLVVLGLNAVSERVSFSAVIEQTRLLRWLDRIGRLSERVTADPVPLADASAPNLETPSTPRPEEPGSRYDSPEDANPRKA